MKVALDTNILVCAEGLSESEKQRDAMRFTQAFPARDVYVPIQVLGELFTVLVRKANRKPDAANEAVETWATIHPVVPTEYRDMRAAAELVALHRFAFWDAVIVAASAHAGCSFLLSEDMHHGFTWRGLTIANPFAPDLPPRLRAVLTPRH